MIQTVEVYAIQTLEVYEDTPPRNTKRPVEV